MESSETKIKISIGELMDGFSGGVWGVQTPPPPPPGSGKTPQKMLKPPKKIGNPPRNFTDFQYSQLQFRLFHYDEIILTAKA